MHINALARLVKEHDYLTDSANNLTYNPSLACSPSGCEVTCGPTTPGGVNLRNYTEQTDFVTNVCMIQSACYAMQICSCLFLCMLIRSRVTRYLVLSCNFRYENSKLNIL